MSEYKTSKGRPVDHCHITPCWPRELTDPEKAQIRQIVAQQFPGVSEVAPPTRQYNCHGHAHAQSHGWFNDPRPFMEDDYIQATMAHPQPGDAVVYVKDGNHTHSAIVLLVSGNQITQMRSKWGQFPELLHQLRQVPGDYGEPVYLIRRRVMLQQSPLESPSKMRIESIELALTALKGSDSYFRVMLASNPGTARQIISGLPGISEIIATGAGAGPLVLRFFESESVQDDDILSGIALYLLGQLAVSDAKPAIARFLMSKKLSMVTADIAPFALLSVAGIEVPDNEDARARAFREAHELVR